MNLARTPEAPYYAVIFSSLRAEGAQGDAAMTGQMEELAALQPGFLGVESARGADGLGVTVSSWRDWASISSWKQDVEHSGEQKARREGWYADFTVGHAGVGREYSL